MRIPGSRTMARIVRKMRSVAYDVLGMDAIQEERHRQDLVTSMGFDGQWDDHRTFQMDFLRRNGLTGDTRFLEIGSGPLTLGLPLMQALKPGNYTGVDVRANVTNLAYTEIARAGLAARNPRLIVSDNFGASALGDETFDVIWSFSVLFHLSDDLVEDWFANVKRRLAPDGRYWANFNDGLNESEWLEFPFVNRNVEFYTGIAEKNGLSLRSLGTIAELGFAGAGAEKDNIMVEIRHG